MRFRPRSDAERIVADSFRDRTPTTYKDGNPVYKTALAGDDRITRLGRVLRRTSLDELPQLWNILRGDMYFIGPRPFVPEEEEQIVTQVPFYPQRWAIKPGATGWAQVHWGYCASLEDNAEKLSYDLFYIKNMSVGLDLLILFQTTKILLQGWGGR
jgi:lipopolysaccharide/colanic/teichoic acid biosynthesis glycosyltransferase